jgi:hypothetical protein
VLRCFIERVLLVLILVLICGLIHAVIRLCFDAITESLQELFLLFRENTVDKLIIKLLEFLSDLPVAYLVVMDLR